MRFDSYHPLINFIYFSATVIFTVIFDYPVFVALSYISSFAYSVKLRGRNAAMFNVCLIPFVLIYAFIYSYYNHFGMTPLCQNAIGNSITLEAVIYGLSTGVALASVMMLFSCIFEIFSSDKIIYLLGRISPGLSLLASEILRLIPRLKSQNQKIKISRSSIGKKDGFLRTAWAVIGWFSESFMESLLSMKCRGFFLRGRTAFSIYRFDNRDRGFVLAVTLCVTLILVGAALNQTNIYYDPEIIIYEVTPMSYLFYSAYAILFLLPLVVEILCEINFRRQKRSS